MDAADERLASRERSQLIHVFAGQLWSDETMMVAMLLALAVVSPTCKTADARLEAVIAAKAHELKAREYCQFRIYETLSDIDGDRVDDFLVVFAVEGVGGGGNNSLQFLVALASGSAWRPVIVQVGARGRRLVKSIEASGGVVVLHVLEYAPTDAMCCPTRSGTARYRIEGGGLKELNK
jgi:hypothetical protein